MRVLVTGCNGYVGSHLVKNLSDHGHEVYGVDCRATTNKEIISSRLSSYRETFFEHVRYKETFDAVFHLAAYVSVVESVSCPLSYVNNNGVVNFHFLSNVKTEKFVLASTQAVSNITSPYAISKVLAENILENAKDIPYRISARFSNVAGSDGVCRETHSSHLIKVAAETAAGKREELVIFGDDYQTLDGTCVRDYVHVSDVTDALMRIAGTKIAPGYSIENICSGKNFSNREIATEMKIASGKDFKVRYGKRREGDPSHFETKFPSAFCNTTQRTIQDMCLSTYEMETKNG